MTEKKLRHCVARYRFALDTEVLRLQLAPPTQVLVTCR
jgi:hypothetical protein